MADLRTVIVSIICIALLRGYNLHFGGDVISGSYTDRYMTGTITIGGFLIISLALLASYFYGEAGTYQKLLELIFNFAATIMFFVTGGLVLDYYTSAMAVGAFRGAGKTLGAFCLVNGFLYLIDTYMAYKYGYDAS
ncbi:hypothetical protein QYM36_003088 [Artemia franciscana]|uniref:MARVEL domain-containing protein n=1 Tax=Artemia franciscana TaxID=6661 RepID=A0AA88LA34_ARTSF|nr:hypothetical protein QYM36_003088 [Artemia franciscana]